MLIIPAIDLKNGQCVRLLQGREDAVTAYSNDPVEVAVRWVSEGAELIHLVDLDGAFSGDQKNLESIKAIRNAVDVELELGGGIRDLDRIDLLMNLGINRVILGTIAIAEPELFEEAAAKYPGRVFVGIDARDGRVAVRGWVELTSTDAGGLATDMTNRGAAGIIYTDISRDGMMTGPNISAMREMVDHVDIPVIASGGVSGMGDISRLLTIDGLWGVISGKALYEGTVRLNEAINLAKESRDN
ncbi:1-(5-phosphoribosyl)-5-[(5-phosphoribosylamino) methylideneamino] imidazole-4-carboxamide isomerase [bacterium BMS3Bbin05]|nr:1-(5-phosphoribosyl)-5-[(5-phosphoribosylamino) methylideneamino] imidazole-4-carboxamide isomerase [bacterium BMS3Bbin05]HDL20793.1 1-(5-phosphoribosyl)-5-[(5-phosphoribosylamino)methylideneamino]imidazole-4-carboxamide isomerase [Nitrospirota bacterium]